MAVTFKNICKSIGDRELVIMPNPEKVLINFLSSSPPKKLSSDYLYAFKASRLKQYKNLENLSLLIYEDIPLPEKYYRTPGLNLILTKNPDSFHSLKQEFQDIFDEQVRINNYAFQMMKLCHQNADKQILLDTAYSMINNPMLLVDSNLTLIASVGAYTGINEPIIDYCLENKHMPPSFLDEMIQGVSLKTDKSWPALILLEPETYEFISTPLIAGRITRGKLLLGYIKVFEYNHPITDLEKSYLMILCDFMAIVMTNSLPYLPVSNLRIEDFLADLLSRRISGKEAIESRVFLYHLNSSQKQYVIAIKYNSHVTNTDRLYHFKRQLLNIFGTPTIIFYEQKLVMIVSASALKEHKKELQSFLSAYGLSAGISLPFTSYVDVPKYYSQALACLEMQTRFALKDIMIDYEDWKLTHIFLHLQECCELEDLIPNSIRILESHDKTRGTNLVETLFTYVHHRQNITESAAELHLHYNTMKYRINQIIELTQIDFDNYNYMFQVIIAEKVLDILKKDVTAPSVN